MFVGNCKTKTIHYQDCHYAAIRLHPENRVFFYSIEETFRKGYHLCHFCSPLVREMRERKRELQTLSQELGIFCFVRKGQLHIHSPHSQWYVLPADDGKRTLFHRNTLGKTDACHVQCTVRSGIPELIRYISAHDRYRQQHPLPAAAMPKPAAVKGSKRWRKEKKAAKRVQKRVEICRVRSLIDSLDRCRLPL